MAEELESLTGTVQHLKCQKPTFCAGHIHCDGRSVSFSVRGFVKSGDCVTLRGKWETHAQYGRQFKARDADVALPTDPAGLAKWMEWNVLGVGPVGARKLVDEFGVEVMERAASDPQAVAIFARLPIATVEAMAEKWTLEKSRVGALTYFAALGLTKRQCETLVETIRVGAVQLVQDDPFQLIGRVDGFGWVVVDGLAKRLNVVGTDPRRLKGALAAVVREQGDKGSTAVPVVTACQLAADKLGVRDPLLVADVVTAAVERGDVRRFGGGTDETDHLATPFAYVAESFVWSALAHMTAGPGADEDKARALAENYRTIGGITLDDSQLEAVVNAIRHRVSVVTGSAGSGKTSLSRAIAKFYADGDVPVRLAAPTGKAAQRMRQVIGRDAETIHRLLEFNGGTGHFARDRTNPLTDCAVIVDEASMISAELFYRLLVALGPRTCLILVGDPNQLPPVGAGAPLRDILAHGLAPATRLEKCHRQAGYLKTNCTAVLSGTVEPSVTDEEPSPWMVHPGVTSGEALDRAVRALYATHLGKWGYDPVRDTQFVSAKHEGSFGTKRINLLFQHLHQNKLGRTLAPPAPDAHEERPTLYPGDKVVQDKNDYDLNVMNGEIGVVRAVDPCDDGSEKPYASLVVDFSGRGVVYPFGKGGSVSLAYCLSGHRMQGSQAPCVVTVVPKSHSFMQTRAWLYTCVTRAQKTAVLLGDPDGIRRAAERTENDERGTVLRVLAAHEQARP